MWLLLALLPGRIIILYTNMMATHSSYFEVAWSPLPPFEFVLPLDGLILDGGGDIEVGEVVRDGVTDPDGGTEGKDNLGTVA